MIGNGGGVRQVSLGPVQVRLSGMVRGEAEGISDPIGAPSIAQATVALERAARVSGATGVAGVESDYRRQKIAAGPLCTQTVIVVQAWGTAVGADAEAATEE